EVEITKSTLRDKSVVDCIISSIKNTRFDSFDSENNQPISEAVYFVFDRLLESFHDQKRNDCRAQANGNAGNGYLMGDGRKPVFLFPAYPF
ncbi:MAG TPA: hypothetical protein PKW06_03145, partial [Cyclobacteriaceae bacterium]|nr:hypothetical protein [Cyclobacteriaceae bacterium]